MSGEGSQLCEEIYFCVFGNVLEGGVVYRVLMADQPDLLMSLLESLFTDAPGSSGSFEFVSRSVSGSVHQFVSASLCDAILSKSL